MGDPTPYSPGAKSVGMGMMGSKLIFQTSLRTGAVGGIVGAGCDVVVGRDVAVLVGVDDVLVGAIVHSTVVPGVRQSVSADGSVTIIAFT